MLKNMIGWLEGIGINKIIILDNDSKYEPLLEYYKKQKHEVIYLKINMGARALWESHVYKRFKNNYYVYTDPDLIPIDNCPQDFLQHFMNVLLKNSKYDKIGFGLKIDDLPDHYVNKNEVITWESKFWKNEIAPGLFEAKIDTTFALYRPFHWGGDSLRAARTGYPYLLHHLPWYVDSLHLEEEEKYYIDHIQKGEFTHWSNRVLK